MARRTKRTASRRSARIDRLSKSRRSSTRREHPNVMFLRLLVIIVAIGVLSLAIRNGINDNWAVYSQPSGFFSGAGDERVPGEPLPEIFPDFRVKNINYTFLSPDVVRFSVDVRNIGEKAGSYNFTFIFGDNSTFSQMHYLIPQQNKTWLLLHQYSQSGIYTVKARAISPQDPNPINNEKTAVITVTVPPSTGVISAISQPSGANVYVDEIFRGVTPVNITNVNGGLHELRFSKAGYQDYTTTVSVIPGETIYVNAVLTLLSNGTIAATSTPSAANVYVDEIFRGLTPVNISIFPGSYSVRFTKAGYGNYTTTVNVISGQTTYVNAILIPLNTGYVNVYTNPSGASIYVDNVYRGTTPGTINDTAGLHTFRLAKSGYQDYITTVNIIAGTTITLSVNLTPLLNGTISATSNPSGAAFYLDTVWRGATPISVSAIPGLHNATFILDGYQQYTTTVNVVYNQTTFVNANLIPIPQLPDLIVSDITMIYVNLTGGNKDITFWVSVRNIGAANTTVFLNRATIDMPVGVNLTRYTTWISVPAGSTVTTNFTSVTTNQSGTFGVLAKADHQNNIAESDESNNERTESFFIP